jgi:5,10-methylenetetrahydrofolate reductase
VSEQRAFDLAIRRLQELGVVDALLIGGQILKVVSGDLDRLSREIKDLIENATRLMKLIKQSLEW